MRIGIVSDTHGGYKDFCTALEKMGKVDAIIHLGDVLYHGPRNDIPGTYEPKKLAEKIKNMDNIYFVRGNCDSEVDEMVTGKDLSKKFEIFDFGDLRIYATHGHRESEDERVFVAENKFCDFVVSGHTHIKRNIKTGTVHILNPGSTTIPKDSSHSCAVIEDDHEVTFYEW